MDAHSVADELILNVAQIVPCTEAEGPGRRFALWFQGCPLRCPGCCNPEMLAFEGGQRMPMSEGVRRLRASHDAHLLEGITLLGGEPLAHAGAALALARAAHGLGLSVMVFSGFTLEEARQQGPCVSALLAETDILVDGPFLRDEPEARRRWIGSANQRVHFLSDRSDPNDPRWSLPNTLEIRLAGRDLTVNGFPAASAVGLWKRPPASKPS
jgi:anaerobic ribonucleoside-triphosphate reductase activating protein